MARKAPSRDGAAPGKAKKSAGPDQRGKRARKSGTEVLITQPVTSTTGRKTAKSARKKK